MADEKTNFFDGVFDKLSNTFKTYIDYDLKKTEIKKKASEAPSPAYTAANDFETNKGLLLGFSQDQITMAVLLVVGLLVFKKVL